MREQITFKTAAMGSVIVFAVWYVGVAIVGAAIVLIARMPKSVALDFFAARRTIVFIGVVVPVTFAAMLWISAIAAWLQTVVTRCATSRCSERGGRRSPPHAARIRAKM